MSSPETATPEHDDSLGLDMRGASGDEVGRNLMRLHLGLISLGDLGPNYVNTSGKLGLRIDPATFPLSEVPATWDRHVSDQIEP
jgi:hypothetical protein